MLLSGNWRGRCHYGAGHDGECFLMLLVVNLNGVGFQRNLMQRFDCDLELVWRIGCFVSLQRAMYHRLDRFVLYSSAAAMICCVISFYCSTVQPATTQRISTVLKNTVSCRVSAAEHYKTLKHKNFQLW